MIDYLLYYGWGGQGDTHTHGYEVTQQAVWYEIHGTADFVTKRSYTDEALAFWNEAKANARAGQIYSGTSYIYGDGSGSDQPLVGQGLSPHSSKRSE